MDWLAQTPSPDIPVLYVGVGCVLMAILGGFTSDVNIITSVRDFFSTLLRSLFIGSLAFFFGMSLNWPWWMKIGGAGLFGFAGVPAIIWLARKTVFVFIETLKLIDFQDMFKDAEERHKFRPKRKSNEKSRRKEREEDSEDTDEAE